MTEKEVIEIAKTEMRLKGWEYEPKSIMVLKWKKNLFYWKERWQVLALIGNASYTNNILSYDQISVFVDDISAEVIESNVEHKIFKETRSNIFPKLVPVLNPFEQLFEIYKIFLSILLFPFVVIFNLLVIFPISTIKEIIKPKTYCLICRKRLRTINSKQCCHCFFSWHDNG